MPGAPLILVPARLKSSRLPNKPLAEIAGKPMIIHVLDRAYEAIADTNRIIAAVDGVDLASVVEAAGYKAIITDPNCPSGTDRIAEALKDMALDDDQIIINLQGDEPQMPSACLHQVGDLLMQNKAADWSTLITPATSKDYHDPNVVKAVVNDNGQALYFSRSPVPYHRDKADPHPTAYRHIGLYAYRYGALKQVVDAPPSALEQAEKLEQLRALALGLTIACGITHSPPPRGVDTPEDLDTARQSLKSQSFKSG